VYQLSDIRHVHLEPSTLCNAACPMCPRNLFGRTSPGLVQTSLTAAQIASLFPAEVAGRLRGVDFCGSYGEPVLTPDLLNIVSYFRVHSPTARLVIYSNGGVRSTRWWRKLAALLDRPGRVVFGFDGSDRTSSVYRRNVDFDKALANATAFIEAGGEAQWDFLVFRHNEHQVEAAENLSRQLGFVEFQAKKSGRFVRSAMEYVAELDGEHEIGSFPVHGPDGQVVGSLQPPANLRWRNGSTATVEKLMKDNHGLQRMLDLTPIACRAIEDSSVFLGAQGLVFPCCQTYTAATLPSVTQDSRNDTQLPELIESLGGFGTLNALQVGLRAAVESRTMAAIKESWDEASITEGRLKVCARVCGKLETFRKQFSSEELVPGPAGYLAGGAS
jgi:hypothetical protein